MLLKDLWDNIHIGWALIQFHSKLKQHFISRAIYVNSHPKKDAFMKYLAKNTTA